MMLLCQILNQILCFLGRKYWRNKFLKIYYVDLRRVVFVIKQVFQGLLLILNH